MEKHIAIAIVANIKQGDLWSALEKKNWSVAEAARELDISRKKLDMILNLKGIPNLTLEEEVRLAEFTGKTLEQMFPADFKARDLVEGRRKFTLQGSYDPVALGGSGIRCLPQSTASQDDDRTIILQEIMRRARLSVREQDVIEMRMVEGLLLEEIAKTLGVTRERVRQIEIRALKKLRFAGNDMFGGGKRIASLDALLAYRP